MGYLLSVIIEMSLKGDYSGALVQLLSRKVHPGTIGGKKGGFILHCIV